MNFQKSKNLHFRVIFIYAVYAYCHCSFFHYGHKSLNYENKSIPLHLFFFSLFCLGAYFAVWFLVKHYICVVIVIAVLLFLFAFFPPVYLNFFVPCTLHKIFFSGLINCFHIVWPFFFFLKLLYLLCNPSSPTTPTSHQTFSESFD